MYWAYWFHLNSISCVFSTVIGSKLLKSVANTKRWVVKYYICRTFSKYIEMMSSFKLLTNLPSTKFKLGQHHTTKPKNEQIERKHELLK